ncbi:hypothetical protein [Celeribacter halophilus]|uniref:Uncharacterized protein n=1 Tax=Celeribacter halophilus TaxID=576117 RepID=A0A1I3WSY0_9RHOB|nr:hypothetical protein [Celeribacter halophilus]PZX05969.1 hypothetical protein LX82_03529 [Celeribacter halophilus]SFK09566.1 hypothetical protein SAMN04488138_12917 [Celeribacter halophilus]
MSKRLCVLGDDGLFVCDPAQRAARWPDLWFEQGQVDMGADLMAGYDGFVISGLGIAPVVEIFGELSCLDMPSVEDAMSALDSERPLASTAMLRAYTRERLEATQAVALARSLRAKTEVPIFLVSLPRPSAEACQTDGREVKLSQLAAQGDGPFVSAWFDRIAGELCADIGVHFLPQPRVSLTADGMFTKEDYVSTRSTTGAEYNTARVNAEFACLVIDQVAHALKTCDPA